MVKGLAVFQQWFKDFEDHYVLIGGTAASLTMAEAGLPFRSTKDLDIVLHVEVLTPDFVQRFWAFVQAGGYQQKEGDPTQRPCLYRFQKPQDDEFPHVLELFSRIPDGLNFVLPGHLTPIPMDEQASSLSAILLDDDYYQFVLTGRRNRYGMPCWVGEDRLIPLKAIACLEMTARVRQGEVIDARKINKHLADIVKLSALLQPGLAIEAPQKIQADLEQFVQWIAGLERPELEDVAQRLLAAYELQG